MFLCTFYEDFLPYIDNKKHITHSVWKQTRLKGKIQDSVVHEEGGGCLVLCECQGLSHVTKKVDLSSLKT